MRAKTWSLLTSFAVAGSLVACTKSNHDVALSRTEDAPIPDVPVPPADGPKLGSISHTTPVRVRPARNGKIIGYLHAGGTVARAEKPYSEEGCKGGWYPVRPRGFVCLEEGATLDLRHPTLVTMAIQPNLAEALPYAYARTSEDVQVFEVDDSKERAVRALDGIPSQSGIAVVGSWEAADASGEKHRLAMMTNGRFVDAEKLEQARPSTFQGVELTAEVTLPVAFVVKEGVHVWKLSDTELARDRALRYHERLALNGKTKKRDGEKYWELREGGWVRHKDVTTAQGRDTAPAFVNGDLKWVDISIVMGTAVAYEGMRPVYATLVSVGKDRLGLDTATTSDTTTDGTAANEATNEAATDEAAEGETVEAKAEAKPEAAKPDEADAENADAEKAPRDTTGDVPNGDVTRRGEFEIVAKHITALDAQVKSFANRVEIYDTPWTLELSSGQLLHGSYWHDRFGIEHGPGNVQLAPMDARWIWQWAAPEVPEGWHAVTALDPAQGRTLINIRK